MENDFNIGDQTVDGQKRNIEKNTSLAAVSHIGGLLTGFLIPLIIYLTAKDDFTKDQGKEALNFQINVMVALIISFLLMFVFIGFLLLSLVLLFDIIFAIIATIKSSKGEKYRYPLIIRIIK